MPNRLLNAPCKHPVSQREFIGLRKLRFPQQRRDLAVRAHLPEERPGVGVLALDGDGVRRVLRKALRNPGASLLGGLPLLRKAPLHQPDHADVVEKKAIRGLALPLKIIYLDIRKIGNISQEPQPLAGFAQALGESQASEDELAEIKALIEKMENK